MLPCAILRRCNSYIGGIPLYKIHESPEKHCLDLECDFPKLLVTNLAIALCPDLHHSFVAVFSFDPSVIIHDGSRSTIHWGLFSSTTRHHPLLLLCWECVLHHTHALWHHVHPALIIQLIARPSLSMHKNPKCILPLTPPWFLAR